MSSCVGTTAVATDLAHRYGGLRRDGPWLLPGDGLPNSRTGTPMISVRWSPVGGSADHSRSLLRPGSLPLRLKREHGRPQLSDRPAPISLDAFIAQVDRDRPMTLKASDLDRVTPKPWVLRAGSGKSARIRMLMGDVRYERQPGEAVWHLAQNSSDLDIEDVA